MAYSFFHKRYAKAGFVVSRFCNKRIAFLNFFDDRTVNRILFLLDEIRNTLFVELKVFRDSLHSTSVHKLVLELDSLETSLT